jgi:uncharacterized protein (DUF1697 family)
VNRYVAFLRAVNIGGRVVKMDRLRRVFESQGYTGVQTFIASGNVVFESPDTPPRALERELEAAQLEAFGFPVVTFVRPLRELAAVAKHRPFRSDSGAGLYIAFLKEAPPKAAQRNVLALANDVDDFRFRGREMYWQCRGRFSDSLVSGSLLAKALGVDATVRNSTTVRKMAEKFCGDTGEDAGV